MPKYSARGMPYSEYVVAGQKRGVNRLKVSAFSPNIYPAQRRIKMPKLKTHRAAAKRYKVTGTGKITRRHAGIGHLLQHKSEGRKRKIFGDITVSETHVDLVSKELPYKKYAR